MRRQGRTDWRVVAIVVAPLLAACLVLESSRSAFSAQTGNTGNTWSAGTVAIGDDDSGSALFSVNGARPGPVLVRCIKVTYTGSLDASVKMYATGVSGALAPSLDVTVVGGSGSTDALCTGFTPSGGAIFSGTLADMPTTFGTGRGSYAPAGSATSSYSYQITTFVRDDAAAMGQSAGATFTWEARNT